MFIRGLAKQAGLRQHLQHLNKYLDFFLCGAEKEKQNNCSASMT
jgi:hypothetical protein